jgi:hypothetical protein
VERGKWKWKMESEKSKVESGKWKVEGGKTGEIQFEISEFKVESRVFTGNSDRFMSRA